MPSNPINYLLICYYIYFRLKFLEKLTSVFALCINFLAWTSCPCPIEILLHIISNFLARCSILCVGSEPILRKQIIGVSGLDSSSITSKRVITGSAYFSPNEADMYFRDCDSVLSIHQALKIHYIHCIQCSLIDIFQTK